jgi:arsenate reductase
MSETIIYHNPACGTSRNTLALLREEGLEPTVVEYLKTGWTKPQLQQLLKAMGKSPRDILRQRGPAEEMGLNAPSVSDEALLDAMVQHPILVERPIVVTDKGVVLCRPMDLVRTVL